MVKKLPKKVQEILAEAKGQLSALYADRLKGMILFGSYSRKTLLILNAPKEGVRIWRSLSWDGEGGWEQGWR